MAASTWVNRDFVLLVESLKTSSAERQRGAQAYVTISIRQVRCPVVGWYSCFHFAPVSCTRSCSLTALQRALNLARSSAMEGPGTPKLSPSKSSPPPPPP